MFLKVPVYDGHLRIDESQVEVALKHDQDPLNAWINRHPVRLLTVQQTRATSEHATGNEGTLKEIATFHIVSVLSPWKFVSSATADVTAAHHCVHQSGSTPPRRS